MADELIAEEMDIGLVGPESGAEPGPPKMTHVMIRLKGGDLEDTVVGYAMCKTHAITIAEMIIEDANELDEDECCDGDN